MGRALQLMSLVVLVLAATATATATTERERPLLRVADRAPLVVTGARFLGRERVRLEVVLGPRSRVTTLAATRTGTFRAAFPGLTLARCGPDLSVTAVGRRGSRAELRLRQLACLDP